MAASCKVVLMMETSRAYGRSILRGIARYVPSTGPWIFSGRAPFYWENPGERLTTETLKRLRPDGLIIREQQSRRETEEILALGLPTVVSPFTEVFPGCPNILTDDDAVGRMAADYFLRRGFEHFAFCGFGERYFWSRNRERSFRQHVTEAGFGAQYHQYEPPRSRYSHSWEKEQSHVVRWLRSLPRPVGLMASNDDRSRYVLAACKSAGFHVPEQIAILGFGDDDLICELETPPLSSIAVATQRAGYEAAKRLDRMMAGEAGGAEVIPAAPTHVVTRQSTHIFAVSNPDVLAALNFIHERAGVEQIQVEDVLRVVPISRRALYLKFREVLGQSIHDEIKRVRVERLTQMIVKTDLPLSRIAAALGYSSFKNLARYFRQETGMTPLEYRSRFSPGAGARGRIS